MAAPRPRDGGRRIDPLLVFLCLAAVAFVLAGRIGEDAVTLRDDAGELRQELAALERKLGRAPSMEEREGLTRRWIEREVLYREAVALGLAERDPVVKTQLVRAMTHLLRNSAAVEEPTDEALQAWIAADLDRYGVPARWSLELVAPPESGRFLDTPRADLTRRALESGDPGSVDPAWRSVARHRPRRTLIATYGASFAAAVAAAPLQTWHVGQTTQGRIVFRVTQATPAAALPFREVRERAREDWMRARELAHVQDAIARLAEGYEIALPAEARQVELPAPQRSRGPSGEAAP